jgi:purine-binding chemotaxis protein CheW
MVPTASSAPRLQPSPNTLDTASQDHISSEFINFAIGAEQYGVDIMSVREIKEWSNVTHLPKQPESRAQPAHGSCPAWPRRMLE